jgi:hypothetical protein
MSNKGVFRATALKTPLLDNPEFTNRIIFGMITEHSFRILLANSEKGILGQAA